MTDTRDSHPAPVGTCPQPFLNDPARWETKRLRALRTGYRQDPACSPDCPYVLVNERARWGWIAWKVPTEGTRPGVPRRIGVLDPIATRIQRLSVRWLTRRPARRVVLHPSVLAALRFWTLAVALTSIAVGLFATAHGVPWDVTVPVMLLAPLLADRLPGYLDARARHHVRTVHGAAAVRYFHGLTALQTVLIGLRPGATAMNCVSRRDRPARAVGMRPDCCTTRTPSQRPQGSLAVSG
ncbi:hypothetical protein ACFYPT_38805 [Streptomyces sp. NPDC005529]|uniref:hypothetical protein n=1 Tax=unclassified Streptomyces TaxID=2593676 RepID=UPI0033B261E2